MTNLLILSTALLTSASLVCENWEELSAGEISNLDSISDTRSSAKPGHDISANSKAFCSSLITSNKGNGRPMRRNSLLYSSCS